MIFLWEDLFNKNSFGIINFQPSKNTKLEIYGKTGTPILPGSALTEVLELSHSQKSSN